MMAIVIFRINPESWIQFEEELGIERQLQNHSRFVKKKEGASIKILILKNIANFNIHCKLVLFIDLNHFDRMKSVKHLWKAICHRCSPLNNFLIVQAVRILVKDQIEQVFKTNCEDL